METIGKFIALNGERKRVNFGVSGFRTLITKDNEKFMAWFDCRLEDGDKIAYDTVVCRETFKDTWKEVYRAENMNLDDGIKKFYEARKNGGVT